MNFIFWDLDVSYQWVGLKDFVVEMYIGIVDWECYFDKKQCVIVFVELFFYKVSYIGIDIVDCFDYNVIYDFVMCEWFGWFYIDFFEILVEELVGVCFQDFCVEVCCVCL